MAARRGSRWRVSRLSWLAVLALAPEPCVLLPPPPLREFLELGFKYDNLLMEESAQVLEIETFIPMLLQSHEREGSRLKRVVLIGDHHQLPPVVKNMALQKYSHLDQSMFGRFIRLGTPYIELNAQGRARPSLARLYNWRYRALGDLPAVSERPEFVAANPGFAHDFQMVDVPDYLGRGESEPVPFFYQASRPAGRLFPAARPAADGRKAPRHALPSRQPTLVHPTHPTPPSPTRSPLCCTPRAEPGRGRVLGVCVPVHAAARLPGAQDQRTDHVQRPKGTYPRRH